MQNYQVGKELKCIRIYYMYSEFKNGRGLNTFGNLELFATWEIFHAFLLSAEFFSKSTISKNSFRNTIWVSNRLDPDQARHSVGPDLGPNCLQRLSADDTQ